MTDDGPRYARNMYRLTKYTKNSLCIKLVLLKKNMHEFHLVYMCVCVCVCVWHDISFVLVCFGEWKRHITLR